MNYVTPQTQELLMVLSLPPVFPGEPPLSLHLTCLVHDDNTSPDPGPQPKCSPGLQKNMTHGVIQLWEARLTEKKDTKLDLGRERRKAMLAEYLPCAWHC